jgi:hypothetical protein
MQSYKGFYLVCRPQAVKIKGYAKYFLCILEGKHL